MTASRPPGKRVQHPSVSWKIFNRINGLIEEHRPGWIALEKLFFSRNVTSALGVAEVRGSSFLQHNSTRFVLLNILQTR